jgi:mannosyltransferase
MQEIKSARSAQARFIGLILLLILALGALLRIVNLGSDSIWLDEAYSIQFARLPVAQLLDETASSDVHPPLYYLLLHYWIKLFGDSEAAARALSALFGILAILVIYRLAAFLFDRATGLLSALLLALSLFHIEFAQEARMYALLALLSLCSLYFFLRLFDEQRRASALVGYVLTTSLLMHTHVYGFFIVIAENLFLFSLYFSRPEMLKRMFKRWLVLQAALVVLFLPWLSIMLRQFERVQHGFWIPQPTLNFLRLTWMTYAGSTLLAYLFIPLVALGLLSRRERQQSDQHSTAEEHLSVRTRAERGLSFSEREKSWLLLLWFLSPIIIPFVLSQFLSSIYLPKYTIAASTAFLILAARGIMSIRADRARVVLVAVLIGLSFVNMRAYWSAPHKDFWRESAGYFDRTALAGDLVLFHQESGEVPFRYYSKRADVKAVPFPDYQTQLTTENVGPKLREAIDGHTRVWLVVSHPTDVTTLITKQLGEWYKPTEHRVDPGVELYLFEKGTMPQ